MADFDSLLKSTQDQAVASWVNYLNQLRVEGLLSSLRTSEMNLGKALASVSAAGIKIDLEVVAANRGGTKGMHGFIAEIAEAGLGNARELIIGRKAPYTWVNNNGPVDLIRDGVNIQQKFSMAGGRFSLGAIAEHLERYPDYVRNGGRYQIPRDHYEAIQTLRSMPRDEAGKLISRGGDGLSFKDWERINRFFQDGTLDIQSIEPSKLDYRDAQTGAYQATLSREKESLKATARKFRQEAYQRSRPTWKEGAKASAVGAGVEGAVILATAVAAKRREGKKFKEFNPQDWTDVLSATGLGVAKGGARGISLYSLTNFTATSATVATSIVTATFAVAEQAHRLRRGEIDELRFLENAELVCLEAAVAALSSLVGQAVIPVPLLGAVIGNAIGTMMLRAVSESLSAKETELISEYAADQRALDEELALKYGHLLDQLEESLGSYVALLGEAFSPDLRTALLGSAVLARELGVPAEEILDSKEKTVSYFLD